RNEEKDDKETYCSVYQLDKFICIEKPESENPTKLNNEIIYYYSCQLRYGKTLSSICKFFPFSTILSLDGNKASKIGARRKPTNAPILFKIKSSTSYIQ